MDIPATPAKIVYNHEEIVVGSNLLAVLFAFNNNLPIFFTQPEAPFRFDWLDTSLDLSCIGIEADEKVLQTHEKNLTVGVSKKLLWERLLFTLSCAGLVPCSTLCTNMRYNGTTIVCSNEYSKIAELQFEKVYYFGDNATSGLIHEKELADPLYMCYDWIAFNRGGKHEIDLIETTDNFVNQIWFYPSDRIDGNTTVKDACLVSHLTKTQLLDFDYSQTMARFKMIAMMRDKGMKGLFNGCSPTGSPKYYKFRTTVLGRERRKKLEVPQSSAHPVEIPTVAEEDLLRDLPGSSVAYHRFLKYL